MFSQDMDKSIVCGFFWPTCRTWLLCGLMSCVVDCDWTVVVENDCDWSIVAEYDVFVGCDWTVVVEKDCDWLIAAEYYGRNEYLGCDWTVVVENVIGRL